MSNQGLAYILSGLTGIAKGKIAADEIKAKRQADEADRLLKQKTIDLQNRNLEQQAEELGLRKRKGAGEEFTSGLVFDESGKPSVNPNFLDPQGDVYKLLKTRADLKRMESPTGSKPTITWGQIYAQQGKPVPQGLNAIDPVPDTVAQEFFKQASPSEMEDLSFLANNPEVQKLGLNASQLRAARKGGTLGAIVKEAVKPRATATPEQIAQYEAMFGKGTSVGLTPAQVMGGISQNKALENTIRNQERLGSQWNASERRQAQQFDVNKGLQIANATKKEVENIKGIDSSIDRLNQIASEAPSFKPSGIEYQALKRKAQISSYDPGRLSIFGGNPLLVKGLTPQEQQRLEWYQGLSTDSITEMFERGGKQLTPTEKMEISNLAITPNDTSEQIAAKIPRLRARLEKEREKNMAVIGQFSSAGGGVSSSPLKSSSAPKNKPSENKQSANMQIDKKRIPGETIEQWRARTKGK